MRGSYQLIGCGFLAMTLSACEPPKPAKPAPTAQDIHKSLSASCTKTLPPKSTKNELMQCMAAQGDTIAQVFLANDLLTKNRTKERCGKAVWWLDKAAHKKDVVAMAALAQLYQGERLYKTGQDITVCTRLGHVKKDKVKSYGYLLAAQNIADQKKPKDPKKPFISCRPDYKLQLESWAEKMTPVQKADAIKFANTLAPKPKETK